MWGTDATRFYTEREGWCWFFGAIDHHLDEVVGWHTAKRGDRWAALEPIRCGIGSSGVPRPSLADYVIGTGAPRGATAAGKC
jgi:hypothetical protein